MTTTSRGVGRPRLVATRFEGSPREQILEVAARLFTSKGYAATSTRDIAEAVGIRKASLYYHFAGKGEIVTELLAQTIRPTVDSVAQIESLTDDPGTVLYMMALTDVRTLVEAPHNIGWLYLAPDVAQVEGFDEFTEARSDLAATYARLAEPIATSEVLGALGSVRLERSWSTTSRRSSGYGTPAAGSMPTSLHRSHPHAYGSVASTRLASTLRTRPPTRSWTSWTRSMATQLTIPVGDGLDEGWSGGMPHHRQADMHHPPVGDVTPHSETC